MKKITAYFLFLIIISLSLNAQWKPSGDKIKTIWAEKIDPANPWPEYPRPQMVRKEWKNLNGLWDYAILPKGTYIPSLFDGKILVPFCVESSLSGVSKRVGENQELWYHKTFSVPAAWKNKKILLHFGAVDWEADVWINDIKAGNHQGGYTPFTIDITPFLIKSEVQKIMVKVWDPIDKGFQPRGKQVEYPRGIFYTPVTGIWQTVWLEPVERSYIKHLKIIPDIDGGTVSILASTDGTLDSDIVKVNISENGKIIGTGNAAIGQEVWVKVPEAKLWSPESPFLYDVEVYIVRKEKLVDIVNSYVGMRKISVKKDKNGISRLQLNNKNYFQFGPLDQGWWPDGLYTAPTDEALKFDIVKTKELGFNMIRKHVKVEPARWYYHCDREGILVWQDMPNGGDISIPQWQRKTYFNGKEFIRSLVSEENYFKEWREIIDLTVSNPCVVVRVPFNEAWGQFKTEEVVQWTKKHDPSRLVNPASGGNYYHTGDMLDIHHYPDPVLGLYDPERSCVLGEYGGIGLVVQGHLWEKERNWGYIQYKTSEEATNKYVEFIEKLKELIPLCYSAAVYTQITDVEIEVNGLLTYDRKVIKMNEGKIRKANIEVCNMLNE